MAPATLGSLGATGGRTASPLMKTSTVSAEGGSGGTSEGSVSLASTLAGKATKIVAATVTHREQRELAARLLT
jgi:hypothetical protein